MDVYIARQPIYDAAKRLSAYELLYREDEKNRYAVGVDGNAATSILVSDAITVFGINNITNNNLAYINFTKKLILDDFALMLSPEEVVIEILEDTMVDDEVIEKLQELKQRGYKIALDDFVGGDTFDDIMDYVDIIKVDFMNAGADNISEIAKKYKALGKVLLAEKVETEEEFAQAIGHGYELFQGYYFSKPNMMKGRSVKLDASGYATIIVELGKLDPDFISLTNAIKINANLTYKLLQYVNTLKFANKTPVTGIQMALVSMGLNEVRRWILLMMAREFSAGKQDELVKTSFIRGVFSEKLAERIQIKNRAHEAFLMGVFSLMDAISGVDLAELLDGIPLNEDIKHALQRDDTSPFYDVLTFVKAYEDANWNGLDDKIKQFDLTIEEVSKIYLECVIYADMLFSNNQNVPL